MPVKKQKYYFILLVFLLFPAGFIKAAWLEPSAPPTNGNAPVPVYTEGIGQTLNGTLKVDPAATYNNPLIVGSPQLPLPVGNTSIIAAGTLSGIQGESVGNALFGNLTANGAGGGRSVYGLAVDAGDYALYGSGGLGLGLASGDIWFLQQDQGLAWPRESDGAGLYGVYVTNTGELQVRGHGAGINFMDQNTVSRLTVSEAGAVNVAAGGSLKVNNVSVCLQDGTNCPANVTPTLQQVTTSGNTTSNQIRFTPNNVEAIRVITDPGFSPLVLRNNADNTDLFRVNQNGDASAAGTVSGGNVVAGGSNVCRQNGTNCPAGPAQYWVPVSGTNDIDSTNSGAVRIKHDLIYDSYTGAQNTIDFDPWQGNLGNYFLIKSGWNPSYGEKWHVRVNRTGETLLGSNLFVGTGGGVASMTPYNDPTANASWKIGRVGGVNTIEAVPGGGVGSVGDINLKSGTLKLQWLNSDAGDVKVNDWLDAQWGIWNSTANNGGGLYVPDDLKVTGGGGFGGYNPDATYRVSTPSLYAYSGLLEQAIVGWDVTGGWKGAGALNVKQLCIQGNCKSAWPADAGVATGWTRVNPYTYLTTGTDRVGIGTQLPASKLQVNAVSGEEGLRIIASNFSPLVIRNSGNSADLLRVDQDGDINIAGINNTIGGAVSQVPLAIKTDTLGNGIRVECGVAGCNNQLSFKVASNSYAEISVIDQLNGVKDLSFQPNYTTANGGKVGIGTAAPNAQLHLKTYSGNSEIDIQSVNSPYWAVYQDDGSDELRFWNNNVAAGDKNVLKLQTDGGVRVPNKLVIGNTASNPYLVTETFGGETALGIRSPNGTALAYFGANPYPGFSTPSVTITSDLYFSDTSGNFTGFIANSGGSPVQAQFGTVGATTITATNFCFGATCKSSTWGPPNGAYNGQVPNQFTNDTDTQYIPLQATDGQNYWCPLGWVMIGIRNTNPAHLICGRMY